MDLFQVKLIDKRTHNLAYVAEIVPANSITDLRNASADEILNRESHYYWQYGGCGNCGDDGEFMGVVQTIDYLVDQQIIELEISSVTNLNEQADSTYIWDTTFKR